MPLVTKKKRLEMESRSRRLDISGNLTQRNESLICGGEFILRRFTPEVYKMLGGNASVIAVRQALMMKTVGAKYMPKDLVGYSYGVTALGYGGWRDPRARVEELWNAQNWRANGVVWVDYSHIGATPYGNAASAVGKIGEELGGVMIRLDGLVDDLYTISECGIGLYIAYCGSLDKLSKADKALLYSTMRMLVSAAKVFDEGEKPDWGKVAVYSVEEGSTTKIEERGATARASPIFDGYLAKELMPKNPVEDLVTWIEKRLARDDYLGAVPQGARPPEKNYIYTAWSMLKSVLNNVLPGWITVAGVDAFYINMQSAVMRALVDSARVLETIDKGKTVSSVAQAVSSVGGLDKLSQQVSARLSEAIAEGRAVSEEEVVEWIKSFGGGDEVVKLLKTVSEVSGTGLTDPRFWELASRLDKPVGGDVEVLARAFSSLAGDERIGEVFASAHTVTGGGIDTWTLVSRLFSDERKNAILPYIVLKVGEELIVRTRMSGLDDTGRSVGLHLGDLYENCFGSVGSHLAKLYRELGIVVPILYGVDPEKRGKLVEVLLDPVNRLEELMLYASFYSFGIPVSKMHKVLGHYESFIPFAKFFKYNKWESSMELKLYRSANGRVVEETVLVGGLADFFKAVDEVVLGYIEQVKKWGVSLKDIHVYQGLLYIFPSRRYDTSERLGDALPDLVDITAGYAKTMARFIVELEKDLRRLDKMNAKVSEAMGRVDEKKLAKWVEKKYSKIYKELEVYRRSVESLRLKVLSMAQYVHPVYLKNLTEASKDVYETLMEFETLNEVTIPKVKAAVDWGKARKSNEQSGKTWEEHFKILEKWYNTYDEIVATMLQKLPVHLPLDLNSEYSLLNTLPRLATLFYILEDARMFKKKIIAALLAIEEEMKKEEEEMKKKAKTSSPVTTPATATTAPTNQATSPDNRQANQGASNQTTPTTETKKETTTKTTETKTETTETETTKIPPNMSEGGAEGGKGSLEKKTETTL